ncbi:uncharacterized protein FTOL_09228 [Fusarium torulosum]|uniref:Uncharacterized protein n=1 Tax=Fusarium torulosum TaxID=33205 RepID=A0AAE8MGL4_9HYPO|nr:uncharacterized protein FTOL_09228 [Fusarium torulosum]
MAEHSNSSSQGNEVPFKLESDPQDSVNLFEVPAVPHGSKSKPELPAQLEKKIILETEEPVKPEPDSKESVEVSEDRKVPRSPENKPNLSRKAQKDPAPGNKGVEKRKEASQSQNNAAKESGFKLPFVPDKKRKAEADGITTNRPKRLQLKEESDEEDDEEDEDLIEWGNYVRRISERASQSKS